MNESFEKENSLFRKPAIFDESGELKRVAEEFKIDVSVVEYLAQRGELVELSDDVWRSLENTDSNDIETGDLARVSELAGYVNRDWESLHERLKNKQSLDAPIIM